MNELMCNEKEKKGIMISFFSWMLNVKKTNIRKEKKIMELHYHYIYTLLILYFLFVI